MWLERPALPASFYFPACQALSTAGPLHIPVSLKCSSFCFILHIVEFFNVSQPKQHLLSPLLIALFITSFFQPLVATSRSPSGRLYNFSWFSSSFRLSCLNETVCDSHELQMCLGQVRAHVDCLRAISDVVQIDWMSCCYKGWPYHPRKYCSVLTSAYPWSNWFSWLPP